MLGSTLAPLMSLVKMWDQVQELRIAFERTTDVLKLEPEQNPKTALMPSIQGHVLFKNVCFRYPDSPNDVLSDLNLEVLPGQKIAIVGRSGSGKTSLANLLVSLYEPTGGELLVDRMDIGTIHKQVLRRQVGIVEQQPFLFSGTIRENIAKADPAAGLESVVAAATLAGAHEFIEDLPLAYDTQIGERGMTLSGGQKQRLVIARTLLNRPRILILDEATSALDTESERIIQKNMARILDGKTAFIIAHRLSTVRNADKIIVLDQGKIVETGTHSELIDQNGLYAYLNASSS
jgi:ABC-type bacteriocin/lantibiotic exporter with double-glycine peptidase domain